MLRGKKVTMKDSTGKIKPDAQHRTTPRSTQNPQMFYPAQASQKQQKPQGIRSVASVPPDMGPPTQPTAILPVLQPITKAHVPDWILLPLRLFLGITFVYAGLQ